MRHFVSPVTSSFHSVLPGPSPGAVSPPDRHTPDFDLQRFCRRMPFSMTSVPTEEAEPLTASGALLQARTAVRRDPAAAVLLAVLSVGLIYFFGFHRVFQNGVQSTMVWATKAWNTENDLQHGWAILPAAILVAWYHRERFRAAPKSSSWAGLLIAFLGAATFLLGVRALQPRICLVALPVILYGSVRYLWGPHVARHAFFPCALLLFMVPVGFLTSHTVSLQTLAAGVAAKLSSLFGIGALADGTTIRALDDSFRFEVAGGCSGIRSLSAMTVLAAAYVHFTQDAFWKKVALFVGSLLFALLGNFLRIFTVVLVAHFISFNFASSIYHEYSGFIFFPVAVAAMLGTSSLLNRDWSSWWKDPATLAPDPANAAPRPVKAASPISYDY